MTGSTKTGDSVAGCFKAIRSVALRSRDVIWTMGSIGGLGNVNKCWAGKSGGIVINLEMWLDVPSDNIIVMCHR